MGLSSTAADEEAKKRADRAKRFGIEEDADAIKKADRAKRFGIDEKELASGLDAALPERTLKRGRGRETAEGDAGRPGKRQSLDRRGGERGEAAVDEEAAMADVKPDVMVQHGGAASSMIPPRRPGQRSVPLDLPRASR
ncbi:hypothetical protein G7046_g6253 [Stylonectria norvegica]|nr:hypothetical protein G7046_g6253 [Stylonectria norvegica]